MEVPDDDPSKLSEGTKEEATKQPREPKNEPKDAATHRRWSSGLFTKDGAGVSSFSAHSATPSVYVLEWGLTRASLLTQHSVAYEWGYHAFSPTIIEALELLSNYHMSNSLQYVAAQVTPYMIADVRRLHKVSLDSGELSSVRAERHDFWENLLGLEAENVHSRSVMICWPRRE